MTTAGARPVGSPPEPTSLHVRLATPSGSEDGCGRFCGHAPGATESEEPAPMAGACGPRWRPGRAEVHLGVEEDFRPAREADPAVPVPDLEDPAGRLRARGIEVTWDQRLPGYRRFYARDNVGDRPGFLAPRAEKGR